MFARFKVRYVPSGESPAMNSAGVANGHVKSNAVVLKFDHASEPIYEKVDAKEGAGHYKFADTCDQGQQTIIAAALDLALPAAKYAAEQVALPENKIRDEFLGPEITPSEAGLTDQSVDELINSPTWTGFEWNKRPDLCQVETNGKACPYDAIYAWGFLSFATNFVEESQDENAPAKVHWDAIVRTKEDTSQVYQKLASALENTVTCNCKCDPGLENAFAYVHGANVKDKIINFCSAFWKAPTGYGEDSQPGTVLHEMTHFKDVGATGDFVYGHKDAKALADKFPFLSRWNADNFEFFAEESEVAK